jgi:XTP/dITP diphosphohydrolase
VTTEAAGSTTPSLADGSVVVLLRPRLGAGLPAAAVPALRAVTDLFAGSDLPEEVRSGLAAAPAPDPDDLLRVAAERPVAVLAAELAEPAAAALHGAGAAVLGTPQPAGSALLEAVAVMDRLRAPGGCPWDARQTHDSLRQYLVEETYELLEAIEDGDRAALREELGDVLLQVLFHARMAEEDEADPFTVDDVARELVTKLIGRHPHVFAPDDVVGGVDTAWSHGRWEELKQAEKRRESSVDGVALGQPALALVAKLVQRTARAGLPEDLLPGIGSGADAAPAETLFAVAARARLAGADPEGGLRAVARRFAEDVRAAERAARAAGVDPATMSAADWHRFWSTR